MPILSVDPGSAGPRRPEADQAGYPSQESPPIDVSVDCVNRSGTQAPPHCARIDTSRLGRRPAGALVSGWDANSAAADVAIPGICPALQTPELAYTRFEACTNVPITFTAVRWIDDIPVETVTVDFNVVMWTLLSARTRNFPVHALITPTSIDGLAAGESIIGAAAMGCTGPGCTATPTLPADGVLGFVKLNSTMAANFVVSDAASSSIDAMSIKLLLAFKVVGWGCDPCTSGGVWLGRDEPIRCDSVSRQSGFESGCVFHRYRPKWNANDRLYPNMDLVAKHMALATGNLPGHEGLPGLPGYHTPLTYAGGRQADNYEAACGSVTPPPDEANVGHTSCDEYPFASTKEGAASDLPYSICWVPPNQNNSQGANYRIFLYENRILENDKFFVNASYSGNTAGCGDNLGGGGSTAPNHALNSMFNDYGDQAGCAEWSGGDATNSVVLPSGERAWFFSDSFLNSPEARKGLWYRSALHNSIVVQDSGGLRKTITGGNTCQETNRFLSFWDRYAKTPAAAGDGGFFWTGDQRVVGSNVVKFYYHGHSISLPGGGSSFSIDYSAVASIPASSLGGTNTVVTINPARFSCGPAGITWGAALVDWNGAVYVYGWQPATNGYDHIYVAKTSAGGLTNPGSWQIFTGLSGTSPTWGGCGATPRALPISKGTTGFSVASVNNSLWLVQFDYTNGQLNAAGKIGAHPSATPWGFGDRTVALYNPPGTGTVSYPYYYQQYEARIQPGLGAAGQVVISYNVNTFAVDTGCISANAHDARIYRPRFINVASSKFNPAAAATAPGTAAVIAGPAIPTAPGDHVSGHGIHHSGPLFPMDSPPGPPPVAARPSASTTLAAAGIDGSTDWYQMPLGGKCRDIPAPSSAPVATVDEHGIVAAAWDNVGTDVWYYPWMCDTTVHSCGSAGTGSPWFAAWPAPPDGNLWTTVPEGYLDPIGRTTSPQADTNGHRFAIYVRSFGAGFADSGGNSPQTILTVSR